MTHPAPPFSCRERRSTHCHDDDSSQNDLYTEMKTDLSNQEDVYMTINTSDQEPPPQYIDTGICSGEGKNQEA
jgi:hypothetical protein